MPAARPASAVRRNERTRSARRSPAPFGQRTGGARPHLAAAPPRPGWRCQSGGCVPTWRRRRWGRGSLPRGRQERGREAGGREGGRGEAEPGRAPPPPAAATIGPARPSPRRPGRLPPRLKRAVGEGKAARREHGRGSAAAAAAAAASAAAPRLPARPPARLPSPAAARGSALAARRLRCANLRPPPPRIPPPPEAPRCRPRAARAPRREVSGAELLAAPGCPAPALVARIKNFLRASCRLGGAVRGCQR